MAQKIWTTIMDKLLHKDNDLCCLCFKTFEDDRTELDDNVVLHENDSINAMKVSEVCSYVFGVSDFADITIFDGICLQCASDIVSCYKFLKRSRDNFEFLDNAVKNFTYSLEGLSETDDMFDSLFIAVDNDFGVTNQYFHSGDLIQSKKEAISTYEFIAGLKEVKKEQCLQINKSKKCNSLKIELQDKPQATTMENKLKFTTEEKSDQDLKCKECLKEFSALTKLRAHVLRVHEPKNFKCSECSRCYTTQTLLNTHLARSHLNLICFECGKSFNNNSSLRTHERSHYMTYVCQECGRVYKNQSTFKRHRDNNICQMSTRHSPADAKLECDYCGKKYTQKMTLRVHIQYEHGDKKYIECKWCKKKFWCQSRLKAHIVKHTKEKNFVCSICNGKFVTKESLLYHTRIHTGEKPYPCDYCESRFLSASRKQAHIRSHHMNVTVECDICHGKFKSAHYLSKHKKLHEIPDKAQKSYTDAKPRNIDKIEQALSNIEAENTEDDESVNFIQDNVKPNKLPIAYIQENAVIPNSSNQLQRLVYNIVESEANLYELQIENVTPKKYGQVEFVVLNKDPMNHQQNLKTESQVYFVEDNTESYEIKVSENVEI